MAIPVERKIKEKKEKEEFHVSQYRGLLGKYEKIKKNWQPGPRIAFLTWHM